MSSGGGGILKALLPIAIAFVAPELAPVLGITSTLGTAALGAGLGAAGGALTGGGVKGALEGGLAGGLGAGGSDFLTGADGAGLTGIGQAAASKGLTGAATGLFEGGTAKSALEGGVLGGVGGAATSALSNGGSLSDLLSGQGSTGVSDNSLGNITGNDLTASTVDNASGTGTGISGMGATVPGASDVGSNGLTSGGALTLGGGGASSVGSSAGGAATGSSLGGSNLTNLLSGIGNAYTQSQATNDLVNSQKQTQAELQPFLNLGTGAAKTLSSDLAPGGALNTPFTGADLEATPGYQFDLQQGTNALQNQESAAGNLDSGASLKAAQQFGQGLAGTTYNTAFNQNLQNKEQVDQALSGATGTGLTAGNIIGQTNNNIGTAQSKGADAQDNALTGTLSALLSGQGSKNIVGYKSDGTPIYG